MLAKVDGNGERGAGESSRQLRADAELVEKMR
jgi:hypothetical protein